ncbi:hypothetical protein HBB16_06605 [Pseudonocardia sp. MCCB 268]|nr:hypothetical protein [Pseudonocardia cytotoxica]
MAAPEFGAHDADDLDADLRSPRIDPQRQIRRQGAFREHVEVGCALYLWCAGEIK